MTARVNPIVVARWYWAVSGMPTQVYSSAAGDYVPLADPTYTAWLAVGNNPLPIDSEAALGQVLAQYSLRPVNANVLAAYQTATANGVNAAIFKVLFNHENRIRVLEGKTPITVQQAIAGFAALM